MSYQFRGVTLPDDVKESIDLYVKHGVPTGGFLEACIDNDLQKAVASADANNVNRLPAVIGYLYNECPSNCWGYSGAFRQWVSKKMAERQERDSHERDLRQMEQL